MSTETVEETQEAAEAAEVSFLEQAIGATKQTPRDETEDLLKTLSQEAMKGTVTWDKNLTVTINSAIAAIDQLMSKQLSAVMKHEKFQKLEGSWRGLNHLVMNSETSSQLKLRMMNISKKELAKDLEKAVEFDQSQTFKKIYESEFGIAGGEPYAALIGDYEFSSHPDDIDLLSNVSNIAAAGFCPFISATAPEMFGFESFTELSKPRDLEKIFESAEYIKWRSFRESQDSRFVTLTMPRVLARLPYGEATKPIEAFNFEEANVDSDGRQLEANHNDYCWMNAAYAMGT
ncbi:MAG: type VI secretion system contractile sheath large subunit, partial [Gammaproteobacteria bacterium]|nr:type VI secretion system contractile sheath large subunit [Gammaproteobacteria bacterium]